MQDKTEAELRVLTARWARQRGSESWKFKVSGLASVGNMLACTLRTFVVTNTHIKTFTAAAKIFSAQAEHYGVSAWKGWSGVSIL